MNWNVALMVLGFALMVFGSLRAFPPTVTWNIRVAPRGNVELEDSGGVWRRYTAREDGTLNVQVIDGPGGQVKQ